MNRITVKPPDQIAEVMLRAAEKKARLPILSMLVLGFLAGVFIAFASQGSTMAAFNLLAKPETYGLGRCLAGAIFGTGLMLVVIAGGELFTGNTLMLAAALDGSISWSAMLRNWLFVYIGNLLGSLFIAWLMQVSGLWSSAANLLGGMTIKMAAHKVALPFGSAFALGIMCNWLVCLAIWMSYGAGDITGKILAIFFPIWLFITSGFEHSVANMYYIPAGIFAKANGAFVQAALDAGATLEGLVRLHWCGFLLHNLLPVTLGNILGGGVFVGCAYWYAYVYQKNQKGH